MKLPAPKLPTPISLEDIQSHIPSIGPGSYGNHRPFWSVMIPTYNSGNYLQRTLESVLSQDLGPEAMQIEVVDGCSTQDNPELVVNELGKGRVSFYRLASNHGPAHTFNTCIERSRGSWVHILHGDDMVLEGFYGAYAKAIRENPKAVMVLGQAVIIDEEDCWTGITAMLPPVGGGVVPDCSRLFAIRQLTRFPAVVVSRYAYESVGGYCTLLHFADDWDMYFRLSQFGPVVSMQRPYALYRSHNRSDTSQFLVSALNTREDYSVMEANHARLKRSNSSWGVNARFSRLAEQAETCAWLLDQGNCTQGRLNQARWAYMFEPTPRRLIMMLKSWAKHQVRKFERT